MSAFFSELIANFEIFHSNFTAKFGLWFNTILIVALISLVIFMLVRTALFGRGRPKTAAAAGRKPDAALTERAAESLAMAVSIPSVTGDEEQLNAMTEFLKKRYPNVMSTLGMLSLDGGSMLLRWRAPQRSDSLPVLFCAHLDVVPAGDSWTEPPFEGIRRDGKIIGRGAVDCKGTVIALMEAVSTLIDEGYFPRRDIYFAFGHDEETGGKQGAKEIAQLLSRRGINFDLVLDEGGYICEGFMGHENFAAALVAVGEKTSCNFKITANARGGHSSMPDKHTTVGILAEALCRIESSQPRCNLLPVVKKYLRRAAPFMPFLQRFMVCNMFIMRPFLSLVFKNDPSVAALFRTTIVPTQTQGSDAPNIIPAQATAVVNARLLPGDSLQSITKHLTDLVGDLPVTVTCESEHESCGVTSTKSHMYQLLCKTVTDIYPRVVCLPTLLTGGTDSVHYSALSQCIVRFMPFIFGDEEVAGIHAGDECIRESTLGLAIELYMAFIKKL